MHKRYDLLDELRECYRNGTEFRRDGVAVLTKDRVEAFLLKLKEYYEMNDLDTERVLHGKIFPALYIDGDFESYDKAAGIFHVHINTLDRYRQRYVRLAESIFRKDFKFNPPKVGG
jgi:hypothetical protein